MDVYDRRSEQSELTATDWSSITLYFLSVGAVILCGWVLWPLLPALTGAIVLRVVTDRPYRRLVRQVKNTNVAAALALVLVILSIVTPAMLIAWGVGQHLVNALHAMQGGSPEQALRDFLAGHDRIAAVFRYLADNIDPGIAFERGAGAAAAKAAVLLGRSITTVALVVVMLFILFFLFRDADQARELVRDLLPLKDQEAAYLLVRAHTAIYALVVGRFLVACVQGAIAACAFAFLNVEAAILLGAATVLFALIPAVGAYVVWFPVVIYLAVTHMWIKAIILLAVGSLVISTVDNLLYPVLVGSHLKLHTAPIFLSMLGGVWLFGVTGLLLGPILFNLTASLLHIWHSRARQEPLPTP